MDQWVYLRGDNSYKIHKKLQKDRPIRRFDSPYVRESFAHELNGIIFTSAFPDETRLKTNPSPH
jgi:hypothetical protein